MNRKSIAQEYYILATNENGYMPVMHQDESIAGIVAAGIMDLKLNGVITMENKKITVIKDIPNELSHIESLYTYLKQKSRTMNQLMNYYMLSIGSSMKKLTAELGESMLHDEMATKGKGGLFGHKTIYIPEKNHKEEMISILKSAAAKEENSPHDMALIYLLMETKNLYRYFTNEEFYELKSKRKKMKKNPQYKQLDDMLNYAGDLMFLVFIVVVIFFVVF